MLAASPAHAGGPGVCHLAWAVLYALLGAAVLDAAEATRAQLGVWFALSALFSLGWLAAFTLGVTRGG